MNEKNSPRSVLDFPATHDLMGFTDGRFDSAEWRKYAMGLPDELLLRCVEHNRRNITAPSSTYEGALRDWLLPEFIRRFEARLGAVDREPAIVPFKSVERPDRFQTAVHELKTLNEFFSAVIRGNKRFEYRRYDRDFRVGDLLVLKEIVIDRDAVAFTGRACHVVVDHIVIGSDYPDIGIPHGFCVMSIRVTSAPPLDLFERLAQSLKGDDTP